MIGGLLVFDFLLFVGAVLAVHITRCHLAGVHSSFEELRRVVHEQRRMMFAVRVILSSPDKDVVTQLRQFWPNPDEPCPVREGWAPVFEGNDPVDKNGRPIGTLTASDIGFRAAASSLFTGRPPEITPEVNERRIRRVNRQR